MAGEIGDGEASDHVGGRTTIGIKIVGRVSGNGRWAVEEKLAILRDAFGPDGSTLPAGNEDDRIEW